MNDRLIFWGTILGIIMFHILVFTLFFNVTVWASQQPKQAMTLHDIVLKSNKPEEGCRAPTPTPTDKDDDSIDMLIKLDRISKEMRDEDIFKRRLKMIAMVFNGK